MKPVTVALAILAAMAVAMLFSPASLLSLLASYGISTGTALLAIPLYLFLLAVGISVARRLIGTRI